MNIKPRIILLNRHGIKEHESLKLKEYITYKTNSRNEINDGSAILIQKNIPHKIDTDYITDVLEIIIETDTGEIGIATTYLPPRRPYLPYPDFHRMATKHRPTYVIGDFNATLRSQRGNNSNQVGKGLERFFNKGSLIHLGPDFTTWHSRNCSTTPDIVLGNNKIFHNLTIDPGPLTESDHLPLIITITSKAITNPILPRHNIKKANWETFETSVDEQMNDIVTADNMNTEDVDRELEKWYKALRTAMDHSMPFTVQEISQKPITSPLLDYIQHQHRQLHQLSNFQGWTIQNYYRYRMLKTMLRNETQRIRNENWTKLMEKTALEYKEPKSFLENN